MPRYTGLPDALRSACFTRDRHRCRWCGRTDTGLDLHHIEYRRGVEYDVEDNLISLCRAHHSFVHGLPDAHRSTITKSVAQFILRECIAHPGTPGIALWRQWKLRWRNAGLCVHGANPDECFDCLKAAEPGGPGSGAGSGSSRAR